MKRIIAVVILAGVLIQGVAFADIITNPQELTRGIVLIRPFWIHIVVNTSVYGINPGTNVEFEPESSGIYLGHILNLPDGLWAFGLLWPAIVTDDRYLYIKVYGKVGGGEIGEIGGVGFDVPVKTFLLGGDMQ